MNRVNPKITAKIAELKAQGKDDAYIKKSLGEKGIDAKVYGL